jgi:hypothetical protein
MHLLYLDFDGVLHPSAVYRSPGGAIFLAQYYVDDGHQLFEHADLLAELLEPFPEVRIVLSTSWVQEVGIAAASEQLPEAMRHRVIGATYDPCAPRDRFNALSRGEQVWADVHGRCPIAWLAIDDDVSYWPEHARPHWVQSETEKGIAAPRTRAMLVAALARTFGRW